MTVVNQNHASQARIRTGRHFVMWFLLGSMAAAFLLWTQATALGGWAGLLQVGEASLAQPLIDKELGLVPLVPGGGHDGQISYVIGADLLGEKTPGLLDHAGYRYRRILYPALSSLGGLLDGWALLWGMVIVAALGFGLAVAATANLAAIVGLRFWVTLGVMASPGAWLAVRLLTPDALALGLLLAGLAAATRKRHALALVLLVALGLTKDQYLISALALAAWYAHQRRWRLACAYSVIPLAPVTLWALWIELRMGDGFSPRANFSVPFGGISDALRTWTIAPARDSALAVLTLLVTLAALWLGWRLRHQWLGFQLLAWSGLAVVSSSWVWDFGNNVARAFAPQFALVVIAIAYLTKERRSPPVRSSDPMQTEGL